MKLALKAPALAFASSYLIQPVGPASWETLGASLNDRGDVLLGLNGQMNEPRLVLVPATGGLIDLSDIFPFGAVQNSRGVIVGVVESSEGAKTLRRWEDNVFADVLALPGRVDGIAGFNDAEQFVAVGLSGPGAISVAGTIGSSTLKELGDLGAPTTIAQAMNEVGMIVGSSNTGATPSEIALGKAYTEAFLFDGTLHGIGVIGGITSLARGINDEGIIVGETSTGVSGESKAFIYDTLNGMRLISIEGDLSSADDINNSGVVVGTVIDDNSVHQAFVAPHGEDGRILADLVDGPSLWTSLSQSLGVNERGQIVGLGLLDGRVRAFLATPVAEPCCFVGAASGFLYGALARHRVRSLHA